MKKFLLIFLLVTSSLSAIPFRVPVRITSKYHATTGKGGERRNNLHQGVDMVPTSYDYIIFPILPGKVKKIGVSSIYGKFVEVEHEDGLFSFYAHGSIIYNSALPGSVVDSEIPIMRMGSSGYSSGPHLHLEVWRMVDGKKVYEDPTPYFEVKDEEICND